MTLHIQSDASFLSEPGAKSRVGGYHYLSTASAYPKKVPPKQLPINGQINVECTTMRNVLAIKMEAELGAHFVNCQSGAAMRMALIEMVHSQTPTPAVTDSAQEMDFSMTTSTKGVQEPYTCVFIGSEKESDKEIF